MSVVIRHCKGNTAAWGAFLGPNDWCMGTAMSLDGLAAILTKRYPTLDLKITLDLTP